MSTDYYVHASSVVEPGARIGAGSRIWHFCHVMGTARLGRNCSLGQNVYVGDSVVLGDNVKVQNNVSIYPGVTCEDDVFLGPSMVFTNVINPRSAVERKQEFQPTLVRRGATIGANATVLCGITLGEYSFVGAGAVLTRSIPAFALAFGAPAIIRGWICVCGTRLDLPVESGELEVACGSCGRHYRQRGGEVTRIQ